MGNRFTTVRRHDGERAPGLDLSRVIVVGFLIAAALGLMSGIVWMGCQVVRSQLVG